MLRDSLRRHKYVTQPGTNYTAHYTALFFTSTVASIEIDTG
jgi:hypothetical protein